MAEDIKRLETVDIYSLFKTRQGRGDFTDLHRISHHPAHQYLKHISVHGAPVVLTTEPWTRERNDAAMERGPHKSATEYLEFLREEMADFVKKGFWMVLPYDKVKHLQGLRVSPPGVVPQNERRPRTIVDYSFSGINGETIRLAPADAMQFGRALERFLRKIVHADPRFGPVKTLKVDMADGFYRVWVRVRDIPKLGIAFPSLAGEAPLIAFPLCLPMGWTESPPYFCSATETVADVANARILKWRNPPVHKLETAAASPPVKTPVAPVVPITTPVLELPPQRDPLIQHSTRMLSYIDVFVDDFISAAQGDQTRLDRVRRILFHAIDDVFRPLDDKDGPHRKEPISMKKLLQGDASWETCKKILGWIIDTVAMTLTLPASRLERLATLLAEIPRSQKRLSVRRWHKLLGELRSMSLAMPGARGLFSQLQAALASQDNRRLRLSRGFHDALDDFRWLHADLKHRPTRLYELVPVTPTVVGTHDASGTGAGGIWLPRDHTTLRAVPLQRLNSAMTGLTTVTPTAPVPIVWRMRFPKRIADDLVSFRNPHGSITNSDLELAGGIINDEAAAHCFDIRERTTKAGTDNLATMYWHRKGSVTSSSATAYLLRIQALHQRYHRYHPLKDFIPGESNTMADDASRLHHLSDPAFLNHFNSTFPQAQSWHLWTPTPQIISAMTSALRKQTSKPASFLVAPAPPMPTGTSGSPFVPTCEWTLPYKSSKTLFLSSKSSRTATGTVITPAKRMSDLKPWTAPYATLAKRSRVWGPRTHGSPSKAKWISAYGGN
jgi:hypothetical protein